MRSKNVIHQTEDRETKIQTRLENEAVWRSQKQMAELFQRDRSVIAKHIGTMLNEGDFDEKSNVQN